MRLAIEKGGHVIIDDQTGKIMHVFIPKLHMGKFSYVTMCSFSNNKDGTHSEIKL
jgi:hypothetical protein